MTEPRIGAGIAYYGSTHRLHRASLVQLLEGRDAMKVLRLTGSAYPEISRAEVARDALQNELDCVVYIDPDIVFDPLDVRRIALRALEKNAVVSATVDCLKSELNRRSNTLGLEEMDGFQPFYASSDATDMAFAAVPVSVFKAIASQDTREYTNSAIVSTGFSEGSRPFFSPWLPRPGTLETLPVFDGIYCTPDAAFLKRVQSAGFDIFCDHSVKLHCLSSGPFNPFGSYPGDAERRKQHDIRFNYALCIPTFGALDLEQQDTVLQLRRAGMAIIECYDCPYLDMARGALSWKAYQLGYDGVFFLDHDIMFIPSDVIRIINEAERRQDVVSGVYCMRKTAHSLIGAADVPQDTRLGFFKRGGIYPALYSGLGFSAIPRAVFESLEKHHPLLAAGDLGCAWPFYALDCNGNFYSGEDASFCARVQGLSIKTMKVARPDPSAPNPDNPSGQDWEIKRAALSPTGHQVWLDTRVRIFHKGSYCYGIEDHSLAVPRYDELEAELKATREEARQFYRTVDTLEPDALIRAQGLDEGAEAPHGTLEEA